MSKFTSVFPGRGQIKLFWGMFGKMYQKSFGYNFGANSSAPSGRVSLGKGGTNISVSGYSLLLFKIVPRVEITKIAHHPGPV